MYVQYGCGFSAPPEWLNFDASYTLRFERLPLVGRLYTKNARRFPPNVRYGDIVRGLPLPPESCQGVYASHVLEHLSLDDFHRALENTKKIMRPAAIFRLVVPDLEWSAREYLRRLDAGDAAASKFFMTETVLGKQSRSVRPDRFIYSWMQTKEHLWMWDAPGLVQALVEHGFQRVRPCQFGDCDDPKFAQVEDASRFEHAVAIEARR